MLAVIKRKVSKPKLKGEMYMALAIGSAAPDFELVNQHGEKISLSSYKGKKNVVAIFYPFAFSGICTGELCALRDDLSAFQNDNVELIAISCGQKSEST